MVRPAHTAIAGHVNRRIQNPASPYEKGCAGFCMYSFDFDGLLSRNFIDHFVKRHIR